MQPAARHRGEEPQGDEESCYWALHDGVLSLQPVYPTAESRLSTGCRAGGQRDSRILVNRVTVAVAPATDKRSLLRWRLA
jgi:hypothetical protein